MQKRYQGIIATVWSGADNFLKNYYDPEINSKTESDALTLKKLMQKYKEL